MSTITPGIELFHRNATYIMLRLRKYGQRQPLNVSQAQRIAVEFARAGEAPLQPIYASRVSPGADWVAGAVPVLVTPGDLTARVGSYDVAVTVFNPPLQTTLSLGRVEVLPRPIISSAPLSTPGGAVYAASDVLGGTNASPMPILAGMPVARVVGGLVPATAAPGGVAQADGVAVAAADPGATALFIRTGQIRLADWTPITGASGLISGNPLYLDRARGRLTDIVPDSPSFAVRQVVGEGSAADPQILDVALDYAVVLL